MSVVEILLPDQVDYTERITRLRRVLHAGGLVAKTEDASALDIGKVVREILAQVAKDGDRAVAALTSKFDRAQITRDSIQVPEERLAQAHAQADPAFLALMRRAIANIRAYQTHILHRAPAPLARGGRQLGVRYTPIDRVGVYVPGGHALYPSTVLMTVVPAQVAGVREIAIVSPPTDGDINPMALALAQELGVREVYRAGGAVGIAALAYGTESIRAVHKIVGPGNAFVAEAKRQLFGRVGIDSIAGPSEVLIIADDSPNPIWIAADLLAQAEHNPGSAILVTPSQALAEQVSGALDSALESLERAALIRTALKQYGAIIVTKSLDEACELANDFATEHLQLMTRNNTACLAKIRHGGALFIGQETPVPLGDYYAGPSHVLPTGGTAKFFGPLSCNDFLKASSLIEYDASSLREDAADVIDFASREGLTAHANAVRVRAPGSLKRS